MIPIDQHFGNPTMYFSANVMAASTNHFLDDRTELEDLKAFVAGGSKLIANMMSRPDTPPEKLNELIAVVQGANRAMTLREVLRTAVLDVDTFMQEPLAPAAAND
jgi:hypothetical protein